MTNIEYANYNVRVATADNEARASVRGIINNAWVTQRKQMEDKKRTEKERAKADKRAAFRNGFSKYTFASVHDLLVFESELDRVRTSVSAELYTKWWIEYAKQKRWGLASVSKFIDDYHNSRFSTIRVATR